MDATIREAAPDDAAAVRRVARESWHATYDGILGAEAVDSVVDDWYDSEGLKRSIRWDDGRFLIAEDAGESADETESSTDTAESRANDAGESTGEAEIIGFAQGVLGNEGDDGDDAAELPRIYVHPERWGEGIGSKLLDGIESWCRECGADRLRLLVLADNEVGNAFYEKRGYRTVGSRESELAGDTYTDYVREKELRTRSTEP